jgi:hypothetical protein
MPLLCCSATATLMLCVALTGCAGVPAQKIAAVPPDKLYNPPAPPRAQGAHSGTIADPPYSDLGELENLHEFHPYDPLIGLQVNQIGVFCFANKLYDRADKNFQRAIAIEERCSSDWRSEDWFQMKLIPPDKTGFYSFTMVKAPTALITHSARLAGYKRNLILTRGISR